jgi:hypothetical protein
MLHSVGKCLKDTFCFLLVVASIGLPMFLIFLTGMGWERNNMELEAIKAGKGEYFLNQYHQRQFRWKNDEKGNSL